MARKTDEADPFQGIPAVLYLDNGPVAKSAVFKRVMESLGVAVTPHMPAGSDGRRTTARAKGKVERPFFTISTSRHLRKRPIAGSLVTFEPIISASIALSATAGSTTGGGICRRMACG